MNPNINYDFRTLHEGFLKDIFDIVSDMKNENIFEKLKSTLGVDRYSDESKFNNRLGRNIARASKGLTATFPLIVTEATPVDQAVMVAKAVERKCCALLQMLFAANQITSARDAFNYVSRFHQNLDDDDHDISDYSVDDIIENSYKATHESYAYDTALRQCIDEVVRDCRDNACYHLEENINPNSLNDYRIKKVFNEFTISSSNTTSQRIYNRTIPDPDNPDDEHGLGNETITVRSSDGPSSNIAQELDKHYNMLNKSIIKTDVQKANEATPSLLIVNFKTTGENVIASTCVIGVKVVIHYVKSEDMANKLVLKNSDKRGLFNLIRATTREISFFKDFLFSVDRAKVDALSKVGKGSTSALWKMLELRAHNAAYNKAKNRSDASCAAIATIVISAAEAEIIKKMYRIDVTKPSTLLSIMRGYSFMAAAIIDDTTEKVDFLWDDGSEEFETLTFMSLEREDTGGMYKKVINMMVKGR